jgi:MOB kinase activator 1
LVVGQHSKKSQTYKVKKDKTGDDATTTTETVKRYAETTLGSGNLRLAVTLPEGEDLNEWLAANSMLLLLLGVVVVVGCWD